MVLADDIRMAERPVGEGASHITRQRPVIEDLALHNWPNEQAKQFLDILEGLQWMHQAHLSGALRKLPVD